MQPGLYVYERHGESRKEDHRAAGGHQAGAAAGFEKVLLGEHIDFGREFPNRIRIFHRSELDPLISSTSTERHF